MRVAIVGAGFSGSLLAIHLLGSGAAIAVTLIEEAGSFGRGLAYGAADADHLLNVRAGNMSAFPDRPDHFLRWLATTDHAARGTDFVSRRTFGSYLQALLRAAVEEAGGHLDLVGDAAVAIDPVDGAVRLHYAIGRAETFDAVVLATGNLPPHDPPGMTATVRRGGRYVRDPWASDALDRVDDGDDVLLVGTGLTAMDIVTKLVARGHKGRVTAISRRGLRPRAHRGGAYAIVPAKAPQRPEVSRLLRHVRMRTAELGDWRDAVDGLRGDAARLWQDATDAQRERFLRHLRPWWDVHRHRLAPAVAATIAALEESGRLAIHGGTIHGFENGGDHVAVTWRPRFRHDTRAMRVAHVINCTGPAGALATTRSPLLRDMTRRGLARPDRCALGLDVDAACRVRDAEGKPNRAVLAVGPVTRGTFWEITAVPDIRVQAATLAALLAAEAGEARDRSAS